MATKEKKSEKKTKEESVLPTSPELLVPRAKEIREKLRKFRFDHAMGQLDDTSQMRKAKRELARVMTAISAQSSRKAK
jgi:ribosomal protein L29